MQPALEEMIDLGQTRVLDRVHKPAGQTFYHPELDVLRFFAFLLVFAGHSDYHFDPGWWNSHLLLANLGFGLHGMGFGGVALFFTLSSYLITELMLQEQDRTGGIHLKDFYMRRVLRIWPLYFFFLLIVRPLAGLIFPWEHFSVGDYAAFLLLAGNWVCAFQGWPSSVATPLWSISIEEQFYLVWPLVVLRMRRHIPEFAISMLVIANVVRLLLIAFPGRDTAIWCNTFARLDPFALGALLAWFLHGRELRMSSATRGMLIGLGLLLLFFAGRFGAHSGHRAALYYPLEAISCAALLFATLRPMNTWRPGVLGKSLIYLGRISYGLYVYHLFFIKLMLRTNLGFWPGKLLALAGTIATAAGSFTLLEKPFLGLKQRFTHVRSRF